VPGRSLVEVVITPPHRDICLILQLPIFAEPGQSADGASATRGASFLQEKKRALLRADLVAIRERDRVAEHAAAY
jgi:hypothetical protein